MLYVLYKKCIRDINKTHHDNNFTVFDILYCMSIRNALRKKVICKSFLHRTPWMSDDIYLYKDVLLRICFLVLVHRHGHFEKWLYLAEGVTLIRYRKYLYSNYYFFIWICTIFLTWIVNLVFMDRILSICF